jgi:small subunit ribosomal protein S6
MARGALSAPTNRRQTGWEGVIPRKGEQRMRNYELAFVVDPEVEDSSLPEIEEKVKGWVEASGGVISHVDRWGKRRLAYPIEKKNEGYYFILQLELPPRAGVEIEREMRLSEQILRYMITSVDE